MYDQQGGGVACTVKDPCLFPGWWCLDQACSAFADFSVSPLLVAAYHMFSFVRLLAFHDSLSNNEASMTTLLVTVFLMLVTVY